ncbi:energy-coupling factor transporter transmembrane protein EcfT, partial [bacterium]|nr:energy-coupling factor transporter transmembrane protein EcfT [bacterium]
PGFKIGLLFFYCIFIFHLTEIRQFLAVLPLTLLSFPVAGAPLRVILKGLAPLYFLLALTFLLHTFSPVGPTSGEVLGFGFSFEGIERGGFYCLRLILVVLGSSLLTITTSSIEITYALEKILKPLKPLGFPSQEFSLMLAISLRFIPVLLEEMEKLRLAQKARGASFSKGSLRDRARAYLSILVPLFHSAFERADRLAIAMEVRGFDPDRQRTSIHEYSLGRADLGLSLCFVSMIGLAILAHSLIN